MSIPTTQKNYQDLKETVKTQKKKNEINVRHLYYLAALLARWESNGTLPVCLLCQDVSKKIKSLGHLIPHSILKQGGQSYFADVIQGKESGVSNMGYRAFCPDCEKRFSRFGEVRLNPKFYKPFYESQTQAINLKVRENIDEKHFPWLYFSFISIVWRCLCFKTLTGDGDNLFFKTLEGLRYFLLNPLEELANVTLFVFATNTELKERYAKDHATYKHFFDNMYSARFEICCFDSEKIATATWVFLGPIHILMIYSENAGSDLGQPFGLSQKDMTQAKTSSIFKSTDTEISIGDMKERFFPMSTYDAIVAWGNEVVSKTLGIREPKDNAIDQGQELKDNAIDQGQGRPAIQATSMTLLPTSVVYDNGKFTFPSKFYTEKFNYSDYYGSIVGLLRGGTEKVIFVAFEGAVKHGEDGSRRGSLVMGLNVHDDGKLSYMRDVTVPSEEKCEGCKFIIEYLPWIENLLQGLQERGIVAW